MGASKKSTISAPEVNLYEKLIATIPKIERKGAANPYTSVNGHMFTLLRQSRTLAIRLPENKREQVLRSTKRRCLRPTVHDGRICTVPGALLKNTKELQKHLELNYELSRTVCRGSTPDSCHLRRGFL